MLVFKKEDGVTFTVAEVLRVMLSANALVNLNLKPDGPVVTKIKTENSRVILTAVPGEPALSIKNICAQLAELSGKEDVLMEIAGDTENIKYLEMDRLFVHAKGA